MCMCSMPACLETQHHKVRGFTATAFHCAVAGLLAFAKAVLVADPDDDFIMMTALESLAPHLIL